MGEEEADFIPPPVLSGLLMLSLAMTDSSVKVDNVPEKRGVKQ